MLIKSEDDTIYNFDFITDDLFYVVEFKSNIMSIYSIKNQQLIFKK